MFDKLTVHLQLEESRNNVPQQYFVFVTVEFYCRKVYLPKVDFAIVLDKNRKKTFFQKFYISKSTQVISEECVK